MLGKNKTRYVLNPGKGRLGNINDAVLPDEAVNKRQLDLVVGTTIEANNNDFTGNNTHSGTETFSNAAGVTTNIITERTAGAGTAIKTPIISAGSATLAPTALQSGSVIALAKANGITVTLPACSGANIGIRYRFQIAISCTSVGYVINTTGTDVFLGGIYGTIANNSAAGDSLFAVSTANKTITLDATTKCGLIGGWVEVVCVSGTQWMVTGTTLGTGAIATPFSN